VQASARSSSAAYTLQRTDTRRELFSTRFFACQRGGLDSVNTLTTKKLAVWLCLAFLSGFAGCGGRQISGPSFDVPSLLGKKMDEVRTILSTPTTTAMPNGPGESAEMGSQSFKHDDQILTVTYKKSNMRVTSFQIGTEGDALVRKEDKKNDFLVVGNLKADDPRYSVEFVESAGKPFEYTGVKIIPTPVTHTVILRVTGSSHLVEISYAVGGGATSEPILTIPPWETTISAPDGTSLFLRAAASRQTAATLGTGQEFKVTAEIIVDGKVVRQQTSPISRAQVDYEL
jgi:hypothetical protein